MRIAIAEDMMMVREFYEKVCREHGHEVVTTTPNVSDIVALCITHQPDILLLDVRLVGGDGLNTIRPLRKNVPAMRIVVITAHLTPYVIQRLAQTPVEGFIDLKTQAPTAIAETLTNVGNGRTCFPPYFRQAVHQQRHDSRHFSKLLSAREQTVLGLIGRSMSDEEIAQQLKIAPRTVADHRSNLLHKLQLANTSKLIAYAIQVGIVAQNLIDPFI
ncbi:MAG: response regulator transcription factor [Verrucomicrobia bacterium]|nr:response regulator transcription factor [Verrucomicrobiota bacterium]